MTSRSPDLLEAKQWTEPMRDLPRLTHLQPLTGYWEKSYDMRRVGNPLNRYEQFMTTIDGVDIHFLRVRSPVEGTTPCIIMRGWPGS